MFRNQKNIGLSEPLGYILLFSLSVIFIGILVGFGIPNLDEDMNNKKLVEIEDSFEILHSNMSDIVWNNNNTRTTTIKSGDSNIQMDAKNEVKIQFPSSGRQIYTSYEPITYTNSEINATVSYENGAVISQKTSEYLVAQPQIQSVNNTLILPFINTRSIETTNNNISKIQSITTTKQNLNIQNISIGGNNPKFVIETEYPSAWLTYLNDSSNFNSCTENSGRIICQVDTDIDTIQIRYIQVNVKL